MATVTPVKRNNSKTDNRIIPIKMVKTLITRHFEQRIANTHNPSVDFPNISEHHSPPRRNIHKYFIPEDRSFSIPRRTHDPDELKTCLNIDPDHKITLNSGHIVLAMTRKPTPRIGSLSMNTVHRSQPDRFVSDNEIIELLKYVGHNPQTHGQHANEVGSTNTISSPRYSNSNLQQYIRISRPAWNIFLKCYLRLRPKTDNPITIDFHDTWDALVKQNNNALRNRPGIGYLTNLKRPTGLEWTCIGKAEAPSAHIHTSFQLQKLIESKTIDWASTKDTKGRMPKYSTIAYTRSTQHQKPYNTRGPTCHVNNNNFSIQ
jgi:hypothetical protein